MKSKSVRIENQKDLDMAFDKVFEQGNYCLIQFDIGFFACNNSRTRGIFQREALEIIQEKSNRTDKLMYIEFDRKERTGEEILDLFYSLINESISVVYSHNDEKIMYLYGIPSHAEDKPIEEIFTLD